MRGSPVPALASGMRLLEAISSGEADGPIAAVGKRLGIAPATCFRLLQTLRDGGWIDQGPQGRRQIGEQLRRLVERDDPHRRLRSVAGPLLHRLSAETGLASKLSVRDGDYALTLLRGESPRAISLAPQNGARYPLTIGSSGAALCANLSHAEVDRLVALAPGAWEHQSADDFRRRVEEARSSRAVFDGGSYHPQIHTLSRPVHAPGQDGRHQDIVAAVTLIGLPGDLGPASRASLDQPLQQCVGSISAALNSADVEPAD